MTSNSRQGIWQRFELLRRCMMPCDESVILSMPRKCRWMMNHVGRKRRTGATRASGRTVSPPGGKRASRNTKFGRWSPIPNVRKCKPGNSGVNPLFNTGLDVTILGSRLCKSSCEWSERAEVGSAKALQLAPPFAGFSYHWLSPHFVLSFSTTLRDGQHRFSTTSA
jgi:hypothetical protein